MYYVVNKSRRNRFPQIRLKERASVLELLKVGGTKGKLFSDILLLTRIMQGGRVVGDSTLSAATAEDAAGMIQFLTDIAWESDFVNVDEEKESAYGINKDGLGCETELGQGFDFSVLGWQFLSSAKFILHFSRSLFHN